ncbi:MAG: dTDP-4-dehydrorhamnose reductase [Sphingobacteriales bacterium]|nr:dTDP-4-dehydrorhamnose reductase [Sphingobacteriales bacterium]
MEAHQTNILVTGASGQLGNVFQYLAPNHPELNFLFTDKSNLDINNAEELNAFFTQHPIHYCINCAAYTAVDRAEREQEQAFAINDNAVGLLAKICHQHEVWLFHISTDYVFDGTKSSGYLETDPTGPVNVYGASKLAGERAAQAVNDKLIIIRTSWLYAKAGHNFVNSMIRLMKEKPAINVVNDQIGSPTYANDLATAIIHIILNYPDPTPGIYHYSNSGSCSWYEFAAEIKSICGLTATITPIPAASYPTPAKRPAFSILNTEKIQHSFHTAIPHWKDSLASCLDNREL